MVSSCTPGGNTHHHHIDRAQVPPHGLGALAYADVQLVSVLVLNLDNLRTRRCFARCRCWRGAYRQPLEGVHIAATRVFNLLRLGRKVLIALGLECFGLSEQFLS
jgi:hypothetical protein